VDRFLLYRTFDELEVGQTQRTRGRTITEGDIVNWCALTDTIYLDIEVLEKSEKDANAGLVTYRWDILNQNGVTVCASQLKILTARERAPYAGI